MYLELFNKHITLQDTTLGSDGVSHVGYSVWTGYIMESGYGRCAHAGRTVGAHRWILEHTLGRPLAPGMMALHTCDYRACVDIRHLYEGSTQRNSMDAVMRGRTADGASGRHNTTKLTVEAIAYIRGSAESAHLLAHRFGVHHTTVSRARKADTWKRA